MKRILTSLKIGSLATLTVLCVLAALYATPVYWLTAALFFSWFANAVVNSARLDATE